MNVVFFSFLIGLTIDIFSNTPGMHAFACTLVGFIRHLLIQLLMGKDLPEGINPSYKTFGYGGFFRYTLLFVVIHMYAPPLLCIRTVVRNSFVFIILLVLWKINIFSNICSLYM